MKICGGNYGCGQLKPLSEFGIKRISDAKMFYQTICKVCQSNRAKVHYAKHKDTYYQRKKNRREATYRKLKQYLQAHPCVDCQERDFVVLEFDHVRGEKKLGVAEMASRGISWAEIEKEIEKCEVRCANCHRRKTAKQLGYWYTSIA